MQGWRWALGALAVVALAQPAWAQDGGQTHPEAQASMSALRARYPALVEREWALYGRRLYQTATTGNDQIMRDYFANLKQQESLEPAEFMNHLNAAWFTKVAEGYSAPETAFLLYAKAIRPVGGRHLVRAYPNEAFFSRMLLGGASRGNPAIDGRVPAHLAGGVELLVENLVLPGLAPGKRFTGGAIPLGRQRVHLGHGQTREQVVLRFIPKP